MQPVEIKKNIHWVGAVDWDIRDFHGYSTPKGTTYNAFLMMDQKIALVDTVKKPFLDDLVRNIQKLTSLKKIDYIIVNHVEMDHSGALPALIEMIQPEKVICSAMGKKALLDHFHRPDWPYEVVETGQTLSLGQKSVQFVEIRMLHWPDSMVTYVPEDRLLLSSDGFGQHWATCERFDDQVDINELLPHAAKYYANILLLYSPLVQKLLANVQKLGLEIDMIAPDHGLIWRTHPDKILAAYDQWSRQVARDKAVVIYDTMWHSTETMAQSVADGLMEEGLSVKIFNMKVNHRSDVMTELLDSKAVLLGSPTLNNGILPSMADIICYMKGLKPANKVAGAFGSYGWSGESVKIMTEALHEMKFNVIEPGARIQFKPNADSLKVCYELGRKVGQAAREIAG
jgi:flavorubredoxin